MPKTFSGLAPGQRPDELAAFIALLQAEGVTRYLEIGARYGDCFHAVVSALPPKSKAVALDMPDGPWGRSNSRLYLDRAVADLNARGYDALAVYGDSQTAATYTRVVSHGPYDAVFIDADHTLPGVTADWQKYGPLARIVAFHDIDGAGCKDGRTGQRVQVPALWQAIRDDYRHQEIIGEQRRMGIGVLWT